jgi:diguanylate cyclase
VQVGRAPIQDLEQQVGEVEIHGRHAHRQANRFPLGSVQSGWTHRSNHRARSRSPRHMAVPFTQPLAVRVLLGAGALLLAAFALNAVVTVGADAFFTDGVYNAVLVFASALTLARGIAVPSERAPWLLIGTAMTPWTAGDIYFAAALENLDPVPIPSVADGFYLAFYPLAYAGLVLLVRARVERFHRALWLDGLIAALAVAALSAAVVVHAVSNSLGDAPTAEVAVNMAYPLGDLGLLALVVALLAMTGWKPGRT